MVRHRRHLISLNDLSDSELRLLVDRGIGLRASRMNQVRSLQDHVVGIYFRKTSTRTRTAFSSGALRLGAQIISIGPHDLQENTGESIEDTTSVLSEMLDGFVARTAGPREEMLTLASQSRMAVINAMSADEHPTQAVADLTTLKAHFGGIDGLSVLYVGEGNNTATALALAVSAFRDTAIQFRTPPGYGLPVEKLAQAHARAQRGAFIQERHDIVDLPTGVDVIYTTRWQTTGTTKPDANWRDIFAPFHVDEDLMQRYPDAVFMHDLPAHRGEEVTAAVLDGPRSIAFEQATNKLYSAMAVLEWCLVGDE